MKTAYYSLILSLLIISCKDDNENVFDKSADTRAAEAISGLKADLVAEENGWKMKYQPEDESGAYWVLLKFNEDNTVVIQTDLGARNGEFFRDTLTYRVDNSLGLELIFETYSFYSFLFEQGQATFLAEYEFIYANKTPEGSLVFLSKSDPGTPTFIVMSSAEADDLSLLATELATNINTISQDIQGLIFSSPSYQLVYENRDLEFYLTLDDVTRVISITSVASQSDSENINFSTGYFLQGDSLVFNNRLSGNFFGNNISLKGILFTKLSESISDICGSQEIHVYEGITSQNDAVTLQASLESPAGATFTDAFSFYVSPLEYIFNDGQNVQQAIMSDITGASSLQLYYEDGFHALGFYIQNADGSTTWALREFTPEITGNNIVFNFEPDFTLFGNPNTPANVSNSNTYLNALTDGGQTYVFEIEPGAYEFFNPCTGFSAAFIGIQ